MGPWAVAESQPAGPAPLPDSAEGAAPLRPAAAGGAARRAALGEGHGWRSPFRAALTIA